jgi:DNA-binding XRE family transcriptional regulator
MNKNFSSRLRQMRKEARLNQTELAKQVGLTQTSIANIERGMRVPSLEVFRQMCVVLQVDPKWLLDIRK